MSSPVEQITDHAVRALARLPSQFKRSATFRALVEILGDEIQLCENHLYAIQQGRLLDNAVKDVLDQIGKKVVVQRLGRSDDEYRRIIKVAIAAKASHGGADEITDIATQLVGVQVQYIQEGTARLRLCYESDEAIEAQFLAEAIRLIGIAVGGGVAWTLVAGDATPGARFDEDTFGDGRFGAIVGGEGI